jgi:hypothetical protein
MAHDMPVPVRGAVKALLALVAPARSRQMAAALSLQTSSGELCRSNAYAW